MSEALSEEQLAEQNKGQEENQVPEVETHEGFVSKEIHQKDVNNQHKKFRDEERGRKVEKDRADKAELELEELRGKSGDITVPDLPEPYDEKFAEKLANRDAAIQRKAEFEAQEKRLADDKVENDKAATLKAEDANKAQVAIFDGNMVALGLNPVEVKTAADKIIDYGISEGLTDFILEDPDGPLMVQYLDQNPVELAEMNAMSSLSLFNHINKTVRAKAALLKPSTSGAPNPPIIPSGGGVPELEEPWEKGVKYD